jgi:sulfopyruvate decarboxylase TPP-binding subunit
LSDQKHIANLIAEQFASCGITLVTSLPDNWINTLLAKMDDDPRFTHIAVNREESAIGLCAGAYMGGTGSVALMGASGFMTVVYAVTKINYTYEIPILILVTLRGAFGDAQKGHASNGLYLRPLMESINMPYAIINKEDEIPQISKIYTHTKKLFRPAVVALTRDLLH